MDHMYLLQYRDFANPEFTPSWDEHLLKSGNPRLMPTLTLIEWIERQLESEDQTRIRHQLLAETHRQWHEGHAGIYTCCIQGTLRHSTAERMKAIGIKIEDGIYMDPTGQVWRVE
jgi:hypothetical protein